MTTQPPTLHLLCGKIAAGKSTLAASLSAKPGTVLLSEDTWLKALFGDQMATGADYVRFSAKLQAAIAPHIKSLLTAGVSVVLDFAANTKGQRAWMRALVTETSAAHTLHFLDVSDEVCLARLRVRNAKGEHEFAATEAQFHRFAQHFAAPTPDEGFNVVHHET